MRALYDSKSKSIDDRGVKDLLTEKYKISTWLMLEKELALSQGDLGLIPKEAAENIALNCDIEKIDIEEVYRIKEKIGHGFMPLLKVLVKNCNEVGGKYVHYGCTTQNIQQTGQLYIVKEVTKVFKSFLADILKNLSRIAMENKDTVMPGRTHGRHATPITYGYKVSVWISELINNIERLEESEKRIYQVMMGGAVGCYSAVGEIGPSIQKLVANRIGMGYMNVPSRNICTHKLEYIMNMQLICNVLHKMAEEIYYTGVEEFGEVYEAFKAGTVGSSTMPHKINPKNAKGIIANSQKLYTLAQVGLNSSARMFEGDSSQYMLFDSILDETMELVLEVLMRAEELTKGLVVKKDRLYNNVILNGGLDNAEYIMMKMAEKIGRDAGHELMYECSMETEINGKSFFDVLCENEKVKKIFTIDEIKELIDPRNYVGIGSTLAEDMANLAIKKADEMMK
ncbi:adenylosuccinate lyase family protein [Clostridium sartagoforme]|uniref:Adenylosuccinate lyase family protein n=1 Tax=Clostridium sartagoforme TaxID=84031 RepID=A0A4S2DL56_9CLOT|nr:adenylosuccinate lyase family protein [Clostridium sartagoforme]TGY42402.1 adenylosuccinate lyase family protein [Clostridium sartagoforme]